MIRALLSYVVPHFGRMTPSQTTAFGKALVQGVGYFGVGPLIVLFDLPAFLRKEDEEPEFRTPSLDEINAALRAQRAAQANAARKPVQD